VSCRIDGTEISFSLRDPSSRENATNAGHHNHPEQCPGNVLSRPLEERHGQRAAARGWIRQASDVAGCAAFLLVFLAPDRRLATFFFAAFLVAVFFWVAAAAGFLAFGFFLAEDFSAAFLALAVVFAAGAESSLTTPTMGMSGVAPAATGARDPRLWRSVLRRPSVGVLVFAVSGLDGLLPSSAASSFA
jgi:hypothetical protein